MARELHARRIAAGVFLADGLMHCRMYAAWEEFRRGWKRIYIEAGNRRPRRLRAHGWRALVLGVGLPLVCVLGIAGALSWPGRGLAAGVALWACAAGLGVFMLAVGACYRMGRTPVWLAVLYPVGAWHVWRIMREAARDLERGEKVRWGGREYVLTAR